MTGTPSVATGRAEHARRNGAQHSTGEKGQHPAREEGSQRTPVRVLRHRARRGDQAAITELRERGVPVPGGGRR